MTSAFRTALAASVAVVGLSTSAMAEDFNIGFLGGITGPIESLMPPIQAGAELAISQVNEQGGFYGDGSQATLIVGDTGCESTRAVDAGDRLVNVDGVAGIVGAMCSGSTVAAANNAAIPGGVVMISPASTAPSVTALEDNDLVFRTVPSDAYQGEVLANLLIDKGISSVAVSYVNNDYGSGLSESFQTAFEAAGGEVLANEAHEDGKADYRAEIGSLSSTGAEMLVVLAYVDGSGGTLIRQAVEGGDFMQFAGADGMVGDRLGELVGEGADGMIATRPGAPELPGREAYEAAAEDAGFNPNATFAAQSYDAAFLLALALEKNGGEKEGLNEALREVSSEPGETILPGEWEKAAGLIAEGTDINYEGAAGSYEFDDNGDIAGVFDEMTVEGGSFERVGSASE